MKYIPLLFTLILSINTFGQSPTYQALVALNHRVDNNSFELKKAQIKAEKNFIHSNIFFNYYKQPNMQGSQSPDESMVFSVAYEYLIAVKITNNSSFEYSFSLMSPKDYMRSMTLSLIDPVSLTETKIKKKLFDTKESEDVIKLSIKNEALTMGKMLKIYCEIESFYFKKLNVLPNFVSNDFEIVSSINLPDIFKYTIPTDVNLEPIEKSEKNMQLKNFTYRSPPIVDYNVNSKSTSWKVVDIQDSNQLTFDLISIDLPVDLGTSVEQIMRFSTE